MNRERDRGRRNGFRFCALASLLLLCVACTDEDPFPRSSNRGIVTLALPGVLAQADGSDAEDSGNIAINGGNREGGINGTCGLWFFAFKTGDKGNTFIRRIPLDQLTADQEKPDHKCFNVSLEYGTYKFYLAGNIPELDDVQTANELEGKVLNYTQSTTDNPDYPITGLSPGNLPMYCEGIDVEVNGESGKTVDMHMTFLCAKVRLNMKMKANAQTPVTLNGLTLEHAAGRSITDENLCKRLDINRYIGSEEKPVPLPFSKDEGEAFKTITTSGQAETVAEFYLPEYYSKDINGRTPARLNITVGEKEYSLPLGGEATAGEAPVSYQDFGKGRNGDLERGTLYDITATLDEQFALQVNNFQWDLTSIEGNFMETELWVSDTENMAVLPFVNKELSYKSNARTVKIDCERKIGEQPVLLTEALETNGAQQIVIKLNPALDIIDFEQAGFKIETIDGQRYCIGETGITITANNLKKIIDVKFYVYDMFEVTPSSVTLTTTAEKESFLCKTNMGTVRVTQPDNDRTKYRYEHSIQPDGSVKIEVQATDVTSKYEGALTLEVIKDGTVVKSAVLGVTILAANQHVVHFTAINSFLKAESCHKLPFCDGSNSDFKENKNSDKGYPQTLVPRKDATGDNIYQWVNSQMKIVSGSGRIEKLPDQGLWTNFVLTGATPGTTMIEFNGRGNEDTKVNGYVHYTIRKMAGFTINTEYANDTPIRYPYQDASLSLFNYTSREGWVVADPTVQKTQFSNFKPEIVTVKYIVDVTNCTKAYGMRWYLDYGQAREVRKEGDETKTHRCGQFLIQSEPDTHNEYEQIKARMMDDKTYRFIFYLESVKHNTGKDIRLLVRTEEGTIECGALFSGQDYSIKEYDGAYNPSTGEYDGVGIVAAGTYNAKDSCWSRGVANMDATGTLITEKKTLDDLAKNDNAFRIYFCKPTEPASWHNTPININYGREDKEWKMREMTHYNSNHNDNSYSSQKMWYYHDDTDNNTTNKMIATFYNKYKNNIDDQSSSGTGYVYKADCWAWATPYNNYYPDFSIEASVNNEQFIANKKSVYYMDRKAFITRPR